MLVTLAHTEPPSAQDTVEAYCDAILRNDVTTQNCLTTNLQINSTIKRAIGLLKEEHEEVAMTYCTEITKTWDDSTSSYSDVYVPLPKKDEGVTFTCRNIVNQWSIVGIKLHKSNAIA
jgi:hypothetical protein